MKKLFIFLLFITAISCSEDNKDPENNSGNTFFNQLTANGQIKSGLSSEEVLNLTNIENPDNRTWGFTYDYNKCPFTGNNATHSVDFYFENDALYKMSAHISYDQDFTPTLNQVSDWIKDGFKSFTFIGEYQNTPTITDHRFEDGKGNTIYLSHDSETDLVSLIMYINDIDAL
ncbi:hypothetical protein V6R21_01865 [Limibacter armeniacum]|uniref:hypothetical protein n=1 Tax=Limibacter armeniacum TaxID=466084 RepID=UPI002FE5A2B6